MIKILFNAQSYFSYQNSPEEAQLMMAAIPLMDSSHGVEIERIEQTTQTKNNGQSFPLEEQYDFYLANGLKVVAASAKDIIVSDSVTKISL
jgi:hypothetical protein